MPPPELKRTSDLIYDGHKIEYFGVSALKPNERNARTHSQRQIRQIARSIEQFGFVNPILIDDDGRIICGNGRFAAARLLGLKEVPALKSGHLTEAEIRAYALADNRLAEKAGWDKEIVAIELQALIDLDFEVELTGFEMGEIDILLDEVRPANKEEEVQDSIPECQPNAVVCKDGDVWVLGEHRLVCGDARDPGTYRLLLDGQKAEFVISDPPYNVRIDKNVSGLGRTKHREFRMASGEMNEARFVGFLGDIFKLQVANSIDGSIHQIFMDWRHAWEMLEAGRRTYTALKNLCVWNKTNAGMGSFYRSQHALVFIWKSGNSPHINNFELGQFGRSRTNVWTYAGANSFGSERMSDLEMHPTTKPVALILDAIKDCSRRGGVVLDPFAGSGTIFVACENTGRKARAIEIDPIYCDVAIRRWQTKTAKQAFHAKTGVAFEQLENSFYGVTKRDEGPKARPKRPR